MDLNEGLPSETILNELATVIQDVNASRYFTYATFCLLLYDHALTIGDEIHLVWQSRSINLVKILFVCNRYLVPAFIGVDVALLSGLVSGLTSRTCHGWLIFDMVAEVISLFSTTHIITLRIRALWTDNREVNLLVQSVWALHVLGSSALLLNAALKNQSSYRVLQELDICFGSITDSWTIWLPAMVFHLVVFLLLILKAISTPRDKHTKLMSILILDGFIYFAVVFGAFFANLLIWALATPALAQLPHDSVWAISTLAITRLLLSLQKRYHVEGENPQIIARLVASGVPPPIPNPQYAYDIGAHSAVPGSNDRLARLRSMSDKGRPATPNGIRAPAQRSLRDRLRVGLSSVGIHRRENPQPFNGSAYGADLKTSSIYSITAQPYYANWELRALPSSHRRAVSANELDQAPSFIPATTKRSPTHRRSKSLAIGEIAPLPKSLPHPYVEAAIMAGVPVPSAQILHDSRTPSQGDIGLPRAQEDLYDAYYQPSDNGSTFGSFRISSRSNAPQTPTGSSNDHHHTPTAANELGLSSLRANSPRASPHLLGLPTLQHAPYTKRISKPLPALPESPPATV